MTPVKIEKQKVLVLGDFFVDTYTVGKAKRISPEAPVAILHVQAEDQRPGGAGNVVLNLLSLGAEVVACGRVGEDKKGKILCKALSDEGTDVSGIFAQQGYQTAVKNRIIADNQQIVRVDHEEISSLPELLEQEIIERLPTLLEGVKVIAISDYGKGFLTKTLLQAVIQQAKGIPIIADPKGVDFTKYNGATIIKPNSGEAYAAANLPSNLPLEMAAHALFQKVKMETLMVTRSEKGISLFYPDGKEQNFPVEVREVVDVTGAGDTVLAMLSICLANAMPLSEAVPLANVAAGIAIERFGCARVTLSDLSRRLLQHRSDGKVFDDDHLFSLKEALSRYHLLSVSSKDGLTQEIFRKIKTLAKEEGDLLVYVRDAEPHSEFVEMLASFHDVDFLILKEKNVKRLCEVHMPYGVHEL